MIHELVFVCFALLGDWSYAYTTEGDTCIFRYTGKQGRCVFKEKCYSARRDYENYGLRYTRCGNTGSRLLVCCRDRLVTTTTTTTSTSTSTATITTISTTTPNRSTRKPGDISNKKCEEYTKSITRTVFGGALSLHPETRAYSSVKCIYRGTGLIIGGAAAKQGEFPHMAAIGWRKHDGTYTFECGGTLIDKRFVLTAGHCTRNSNAATDDPEVVRLGDQDLDPNVSDGASDIQVRISRIYKHPGYKYTKKYNDIALLELESEVRFNDDIRPACLWTKEDFGDNDKVLATGWGIINSTTRMRSNELLKVGLNILDNVECNITLADNINRKWSHGLDETQMCAGGSGETKDTCEGDSGGPLQILSEENKCIFTVLGITSFGARFCGNDPSVYTRVSSYVEWIENIVWPSEDD